MKKACFLFVLLIALSLIPSVKANPEGWVSPTGFEDPDNAWVNEPLAYDENTGTNAYTSVKVPLLTWTKFLHLTVDSAIYCNALRFYAYGGLPLDRFAIDIDLLVEGEWVDIYEGDFDGVVWVEKNFSICFTSEVRIRFWAKDSYATWYARLYEFDFWEVEEAPAETEFTFYETMNISASSSFWKAKMFSGTETVSISSDSNIWKEKLFSFSESPSITDSLSILKEKLMAFVEFMETINPTSEVIFIFPSAKIPFLFVGAFLVFGIIGLIFILAWKRKREIE